MPANEITIPQELIDKLAEFFKESIEDLKNGWNACLFHTERYLDLEELGVKFDEDNFDIDIVIGWSGGFDKDDDSVIHDAEQPDYCIVAGIRIYNIYECEMDFMDIPYDPDSGDVWDVDCSLNGSATDLHSTAGYLLSQYVEMAKASAKEDNTYKFAL